MNRAHSVIVRACSWLAARAGAWIIGLAVVWMAAAPRPMWGQWSGTNPVWTNSNVGIGTSTPTSQPQISGNGAVAEQISTTGSGLTWLSFNNQDGWSYVGLLGTADLFLVNNTSTGNIYLGTNSAVKVTIAPTGNVGIGTTNPQYLLSVKGTVGAEEFIVTNTGWSDYVFQPGYRLRPLSEVNAFIQANHHLPDIPSEAEVKEKGVSVGDMQAKLLAKVEELTLHMIQTDERNNRLEQQNQELRDRLARLEKGAASVPTTAAK